VEIDESEIEANARRVLCEGVRKKLEKWQVKEAALRDNGEAARKALE